MNSKHFILAILLVFCLYLRKIHASTSSIKGDGSCNQSDPNDKKPQITNVEWLPNWQIKVTVQSPTRSAICGSLAPEAIGHFTFKDKQSGKGYRFSRHANWVNGYNFDNTSGDCPTNNGDNPYDYVVGYDSKAAPPKGANVNVALSIYYYCASENGWAFCGSCDVNYDSIYQ